MKKENYFIKSSGEPVRSYGRQIPYPNVSSRRHRERALCNIQSGIKSRRNGIVQGH